MKLNYQIKLFLITFSLLTLQYISVFPKKPIPSSNYSKNLEFSLIKDSIPKNLNEAVNYIITSMKKRDIQFLKLFPKNDLIIFHFDWGLGIRNNLGLWGDNKELLKSCAESINQDFIHPDNASMLIIEKVWEKLNEDIKLPDFEKLEAGQYFEKIHEILLKAREEKNNRYLAGLPEWIFEVRRLNNFYKFEEQRRILLVNRALELINHEELSYLALLYLTYNLKDINKLKLIIAEKVNSKDKLIHVPSYIYYDIRKFNLIIQSEIEKKVRYRKVYYNWNNISVQELAVKCFGSLYEKNFKSLNEFCYWKEIQEQNYLVYWKYRSEVQKSEFEYLLKKPDTLLKILLLTGNFFSFDDGGHGLTTGANRYGKSSVNNFVSACGFDSLDFKNYPYKRFNEIFPEGSYWSRIGYADKEVNALVFVANQLTNEKLLDLIQPKSIDEYNNNLKTEDLNEYKWLVGFLLVTQYDKIISYPNKDTVFDICSYYWKEEFLTWNMKYFLTELLFQIDKKKALNEFFVYFNEEPKNGSFTRNGILRTLIRNQFEGKNEFLFDWFWKVQKKEFRTKPHEKDLILLLLKETSAETKKLYNRIVSDIRYVK